MQGEHNTRLSALPGCYVNHKKGGAGVGGDGGGGGGGEAVITSDDSTGQQEKVDVWMWKRAIAVGIDVTKSRDFRSRNSIIFASLSFHEFYIYF